MFIYNLCMCQSSVRAPKGVVLGPTGFLTLFCTRRCPTLCKLDPEHEPAERGGIALASPQERLQVAGCVCHFENSRTPLMH